MKTLAALTICAALPLLAGAVSAGEVEVLAAEARPTGGAWTFSVTLRHADTGWDHYADAWEVRLADGTVLGTRTLLHPHVDEQPFTRALSGVQVPPGTARVVIHARDNRDGWSPRTLVVALP